MFICPKVSKDAVKSITKKITRIVATVLAAGTVGAAVASTGSVDAQSQTTQVQSHPMTMAPSSMIDGTYGHYSHQSHYSHSSHRSHFSSYY